MGTESLGGQNTALLCHRDCFIGCRLTETLIANIQCFLALFENTERATHLRSSRIVAPPQRTCVPWKVHDSSLSCCLLHSSHGNVPIVSIIYRLLLPSGSTSAEREVRGRKCRDLLTLDGFLRRILSPLCLLSNHAEASWMSEGKCRNGVACREARIPGAVIPVPTAVLPPAPQVPLAFSAEHSLKKADFNQALIVCAADLQHSPPSSSFHSEGSE